MSVKGGKGKERRRRREGDESVREARPPLTSYCKSGPRMTEGYTSGSSFPESKVQRYLYDNTVSFQHPPRNRIMGSLPAAPFRALMAELKTLGGIERM